MTGAAFPYWPVVSHPELRRVLPGLAVSALGDGMAVVAISWLALQLAPGPGRAAWVALAVAAYSLPATLGTVLFGRLLAGWAGPRLVFGDALLRGGALGLIPVAHFLGLLSPMLYVALLAASSLLHSWGVAGRFTLVAEALPPRHHLPANALLTIFTEASSIAGPPLAGLVIGWQGASAVIAVDAASFLVLAASCRRARRPAPAPAPSPPAARPARGAGLRLIVRDRTLLGLMALTSGFFVCFGPAYVALPVSAAGASATLLAAYFAVFAVGALLGATAAGYAGRLPLWPVTIGVVIGFGATLLPIALGAPTPVSLAAFAAGGFIWAPYLTTSRTLFQRRADPSIRAAALAANNAVVVAALPLGTLLGGPLVGGLGARPTLLACALAIIALGLAAAGIRAAAGSAGHTRPRRP